VPSDTRGGALCVAGGLLGSDLRGLGTGGIQLAGERRVRSLLIKEPLRLLARGVRHNGRDGRLRRRRHLGLGRVRLNVVVGMATVDDRL
jgi:hypothetical protein